MMVDDLVKSFPNTKVIRQFSSTGQKRMLLLTGSGLIHSHLKDRGLILIDPGTCQIVTWGVVDPSLSTWLSEITGYPFVSGNYHAANPPDTRVIGGCLPGEPVFVNGIIIGYATGEEAVISLQDGTIQAVSGIELKDHGVETLIRFGCPDV